MYKYSHQKWSKEKNARASLSSDLFSPYRRRLVEETNDCFGRHAALLLVAFVVFTVLYVSFVVSRKCGDGTEESCTGNMILDEPSELDLLKEEYVFGRSLNLMQNDTRLVDFITRFYLVPPATSKPLKLEKPGVRSSATSNVIDFVLLKTNGRAGFFVEAGAGNGEHLSNTLRLERDYGWTGLLVEPDPVSFGALRGKKRKSWLTNACLSLSGRAEEVKFHAHIEFPEKGRVSTSGIGASNKNSNIGQDDEDWEDSSVIQELAVKCFPVFSLLSAVNVTKVDFFSLNVRGGELKVLQTIPFDSVQIGIFLVQHAWLMEGKKALRDFMREKGYVTVRRDGVVGKMDSLFVHSTFGKQS